MPFRRLTTGLERYFFMHRALPELNKAHIDTTISLFGKKLTTPLLISSMTGGTARANPINRILAEGAQEVGMAMGLGSQRAAIEDVTLAYTFPVRDVAPDILLFANVGAVQLNYGFDVSRLSARRRDVRRRCADPAFQRAAGSRAARGRRQLRRSARQGRRSLPRADVPVIAKEVGWGFSAEDARLLQSAGVAAIDVAGAGGTSWSQVEMYRARTERLARVAGAFIDWGIPTAVSLRYCREAAPDLPLFASGGIGNGIDVAKCIALGAWLVGLAGDFLRAAHADGVAGAVELAGSMTDELRVAMLCSGAGSLAALAETPLYTEF